MEQVKNPDHYTDGKMEAIDIIEAVIDGLPPKEAYSLGQIIRYVLRCKVKHDDPNLDLGKANNYAYRLVTGKWRW